MSGEALAGLFHADIVEPGMPEPSFNVKPTQAIPIIVGTPPERRVAPARWSLVPPWADDLKLKFPTFNARIETAASKPTFKASVKSKRCLVPFEGYYEWLTEGTKKTPFYVHRIDQQPLLLAGLYSWWQSPATQEWHLTATILTRESAGQLSPLHDRMPVLLHPDLIDDWLNKEIPGDELLLTTASDSGLTSVSELRIDEVAPLRGDGPELIESLGLFRP